MKIILSWLIGNTLAKHERAKSAQPILIATIQIFLKCTLALLAIVILINKGIARTSLVIYSGGKHEVYTGMISSIWVDNSFKESHSYYQAYSNENNPEKLEVEVKYVAESLNKFLLSGYRKEGEEKKTIERL